MIKAIIFDMYGTLVDTADGSIRATRGILRQNHADTDADEFYGKWKKVQKEILQSSLAFLKEEDIFQQGLSRLYVEYGFSGNPLDDVKIMLSTLGNRQAYPETKDVLRSLGKSHSLLIGSNTDDAPFLSDMRRNGIVVDRYFTSESLKVYKPNPVFFLKILEQAGIGPHEALYVGDSQYDDVFGAHSAGIGTVWLNRKKESLLPHTPNPDFEIADLTEFLEIVS